jgi:hypothetical protein
LYSLSEQRFEVIAEAIMLVDEAYFERALGAAVVRTWGKLPRAIQETLFEEAAGTGDGTHGDNGLREHLAIFLHNKHPRTDHHA